MYSSPNIVFENFLLDELPEGIRSWWNIRNDDIFYLRWGDPEYTRDFILNFDKEKTAGYFMGSDGYTWGRVYCSSDPAYNGQLENKKHWYNFMLWGRLGYDPELGFSRVQLDQGIDYGLTPHPRQFIVGIKLGL